MLSADKIVRKYSDMKTLPHVAIKVNQLIQGGSATMNDFEEIIRLDPVLITRMLKLVNSPYFGLVSKVDSISKAVVFMGLANLRNLVAVEALRDIFHDSDGSDEGFSRANLWFHSATVAILAEMIAKRIFGLEGEDFFLAGIIHDIGMVAEDQVAGDMLRDACSQYEPGKKSIVEYEREVIGTDHCRVGGALAREWGLPEEVLKAVRFHHDKERDFNPGSATGIVQLAEYFAGKMKYSVVKSQVEPLSSILVEHVKQKLDNYKVIIKDLPGEMAKAKELYEQSDS